MLIVNDGATMFSLTGEPFGDFFTNCSKEEMGQLLRVGELPANKSLEQLAEQLVPGCTGKGHADHWWFEQLIHANKGSYNAVMQATTRESRCARPRRRPVGTLLVYRQRRSASTR